MIEEAYIYKSDLYDDIHRVLCDAGLTETEIDNANLSKLWEE